MPSCHRVESAPRTIVNMINLQYLERQRCDFYILLLVTKYYLVYLVAVIPGLGLTEYLFCSPRRAASKNIYGMRDPLHASHSPPRHISLPRGVLRIRISYTLLPPPPPPPPPPEGSKIVMRVYFVCTGVCGVCDNNGETQTLTSIQITL